MKKLTLLLVAFAGLLGSCSDKRSTSDSLKEYIQVYEAISYYNDAALDPFNVAYRFHLYREGGATQALKNELLPYATIFESVDGQTDTLRFTEALTKPFNDYARVGEIIIHTYGNSLSDENAVWQVTASSKDSDVWYYVYLEDFGYWNLAIDKNEYTISNEGKDRFRVQADAIYMSSLSTGAVWNWDLDLIVARTQGSGSSLANSRFEVTPNGVPASGGVLNSTTSARWRYEIIDPVLYSTDCSYPVKSGGKERIVRMDMKDYKGLDSVVMDMGQNYGTCHPGFSLSVRTEEDDKWTTHNYAPGGIWIQ